MSIDFIGTAIFAFFALLVFKHDFTIRLTIFIGIIAAVLPLLATRVFTYLPYLISEMPVSISLIPSPAQISILLLQIPVAVLVLLMVRKDTESLPWFIMWVITGIFINNMLLPFVIH